jgi:hypothetical protein
VFQPVTGDVEIVAQVISLAAVDRWSKTGVMIRESLAADSRHAMMIASVSKGYAFQRRLETGGLSVHTQGPGTAPLPMGPADPDGRRLYCLPISERNDLDTGRLGDDRDG